MTSIVSSAASAASAAPSELEYELGNMVLPIRLTCLNEHLIDLIERRVAEKAMRDGLSSRETRSAYWIPLSDMILDLIRSDGGTRVYFYGYLHERILEQTSYARSNVCMEVLHRAVTTGNKAVRYDELIGHVYLYDPYIGRSFVPSIDRFRRVLLDIDADSTMADDSVVGNGVDGEHPISSIPHVFPSLGSMRVGARSEYRRAIELNDLSDGILAQSTVSTERGAASTAAESNRELYRALLDDADKHASSIGVRLFIVNLSYHLDREESLIRYRKSVMYDAPTLARETLTSSIVRSLDPFDSSEVERRGLNVAAPIPDAPPRLDVADLLPGGLARDSITEPFIRIGQMGPLGVVLDYATSEEKLRCDVPRYLLLEPILGVDIEIPVRAVARSSENLGLLELDQHMAFLRYRCPDRFMPPTMEYVQRGPLPDAGGYRKDGQLFIEQLRANCAADGRTCAIVANAYKYLLDNAITDDELVGVEPYSEKSDSERILSIVATKLRTIR